MSNYNERLPLFAILNFIYYSTTLRFENINKQIHHIMINLSTVLTTETYDLIVLNRPALGSLYQELYHNAKKRIMTDGAVIKIKNEIGSSFTDYFPTHIIGDFDSFQPDEEFSSIVLLKIDDQDSTDFEKALDLTTESIVVVLSDFSGRLDHTLGAFSAIMKDQYSGKLILLYNTQNIALVVKDFMRISADPWKYCGIFPMAGKTIITTTGFRWNLVKCETYFGGLVSYCNELVGEGTVEVDKPVLLVFSNDNKA